MKLIIAIVQDEDAQRLVGELMDGHFGVTKLATTGGFLRAGNTTLLSGVEDERLEEALSVIERTCRSRQQMTTAAVSPGASMAGMGHTPYPLQVTVGGATVFVREVSRFMKV